MSSVVVPSLVPSLVPSVVPSVVAAVVASVVDVPALVLVTPSVVVPALELASLSEPDPSLSEALLDEELPELLVDVDVVDVDVSFVVPAVSEAEEVLSSPQAAAKSESVDARIQGRVRITTR